MDRLNKREDSTSSNNTLYIFLLSWFIQLNSPAAALYVNLHRTTSIHCFKIVDRVLHIHAALNCESLTNRRKQVFKENIWAQNVFWAFNEFSKTNPSNELWL